MRFERFGLRFGRFGLRFEKFGRGSGKVWKRFGLGKIPQSNAKRHFKLVVLRRKKEERKKERRRKVGTRSRRKLSAT